jgi:glycine cleavage system regulatory protein
MLRTAQGRVTMSEVTRMRQFSAAIIAILGQCGFTDSLSRAISTINLKEDLLLLLSRPSVKDRL